MQKNYKTICGFILCFLALCLFAGCSISEPKYEKGTAIDGIDVSGLTRAAASQGISDYHKRLLSEIYYTVKTETASKVLSAEELGVKFNTEKALSDAMESGGEVTSSLTVDTDKARKALEEISPLLSKKAVDAYAEYDSCGEFRFFEATDGETPDIDALLKSLQDAVQSPKSQVLTAKMKAVAPSGMSFEKLKASNALICEFTTFFDKSPLNAENRVNNIVKAAEKVNGCVLSPGEKFDTNAILGDRNGENGWYKAPGIRNGKYESEYGGGVCQVSTTLYNAALLANLEIVERTPHSWPVGYIDIGRDATISTGGPNLIFSNNTQSTITIAAITDRNRQSVTVRIFGTKPTGYSLVKLTSEQTGTIPVPQTEYVKDTSLRIGEYVTDRKAREGKKAVTYRTFYDESGNELKKETISHDTYKAFSAIVHYNN